MVNLLQAWAEEYSGVRPDIAVQVAGGGSGVGIAALVDGLTTIAAASRELTTDERQRAIARGVEPVEVTVALDALAVYVHRDNPLDAITIAQLAEVYGDGGTLKRWSQFGIVNAGCSSDAIIRVGRQNSSGTYTYFRDAVLGHRRDYKLGSIDQNGSKDVVALVGRTPCAIGYSGLAYATPGVKALRVAATPGSVAVAATVDAAASGSYPLARRLYLYTAGQRRDAAQALVDWILSEPGQRIVRDVGFIPAREGHT